MINLKYNDINIQNIEKIKTQFFVEDIVCDGDNKIIQIEENKTIKSLEEAMCTIGKTVESIAKEFLKFGNQIYSTTREIIKNLFDDFKYTLNKKISKKRFMKLLQSQGIQRNKINEIVKNNTEKYTYERYYRVLSELSKDKKE